jgi:hypothetical protein
MFRDPIIIDAPELASFEMAEVPAGVRQAIDCWNPIARLDNFIVTACQAI